MKTDHWFYGLFQSAPGLITLLLPHGPSAAPSLGPDAPGDALYRFEAPELKAANHRLDGALWPRCNERGTTEQPVVLLEVQMHAKAEFKHRLWAQTARFAQLHPQVQHLEVIVLVPHQRLHLGPAALPRQQRAFLADVHWLSLAHRPDLLETVISILMERFPLLTRKDIMEIATIPAKDLRLTRAAQEWMAEGEAHGRHEGEAIVALRLLNRRCGPLSAATTSRIQALPLQQLEALTEALLEFSGPADLERWLAEHGG